MDKAASEDKSGVRLSAGGLAIFLFLCCQAITGGATIVGATWWASAVNTKQNQSLEWQQHADEKWAEVVTLITSQNAQKDTAIKELADRVKADEEDLKKIHDLELVRFGGRGKR